MKPTKAVSLGIFAALVVAFSFPASAFSDTVKTRLKGFQEVPAISSQAFGKFKANIDGKDGIIKYKLAYFDLEGEVRQAHIHFGQRGVNGGISVFLCTNMDNAPPPPANAVQPCPGPFSGKVEGVIMAEDVIGPGAQGIDPGEFDELVRAINRGVTYVNVHSTLHPGGEIRGQLKDRSKFKFDDDFFDEKFDDEFDDHRDRW